MDFPVAQPRMAPHRDEQGFHGEIDPELLAHDIGELFRTHLLDKPGKGGAVFQLLEGKCSGLLYARKIFPELIEIGGLEEVAVS